MENLKIEDRDKLQRIVNELEEQQAAVELLRQQISAMATSLTELSMTIGAIKVLKDTKPNTEILVPIGCDSFITAKLSSVDKVITGLGADIMAERGADDAIKFLENRATEIERTIEQARNELNKLEERIETLRPEAERILGKARTTLKK